MPDIWKRICGERQPMFPDEAQTIRNGYTPGPMATDEGFNGLTGSGTANIYHGMDFANGKITQDFLGDGSPNLNQWGKYYKNHP